MDPNNAILNANKKVTCNNKINEEEEEIEYGKLQ